MVEYLVKKRFEDNIMYTLNCFGELHSQDDLPAIIIHDSGKIITKIWYYRNKLHRVNQPAIIEYYLNGEEKCIWFYKYGVIHRDENKPAIMECINKNKPLTGQSVTSYWYKEDKLHRDNDEPAIVHYVFGDNGKYMIHCYWYTESVLSRNNGPFFESRTIG